MDDKKSSNDDDNELFILSPSISNDDNDNFNALTIDNNPNSTIDIKAELAIIAHDIDDLLLIEEKLHPDVKLVEDNDSYHFEVLTTSLIKSLLLSLSKFRLSLLISVMSMMQEMLLVRMTSDYV